MWLLATPGGGQVLTPFHLVVADNKKGKCKGEGLMHAKTGIPYDRSGEPSAGASIITVMAYGKDLTEALDRHHSMKNDDCMRGEAVAERVGKRWRISWKEDIRRLADVLPFPGGWRRNKQKGK